jgi:hypothetical protein
VRADGQQGEWFQIVTGVRQGCLLSPLIFLLVVDWILKRATNNNECGLPWNEGQKLTDLDFADDIAVLEKSWRGMQELISRVEVEAGAVGLRMNAGKTKVMMIGHVDPGQNIQADGNMIEDVTEFCYLGSVLSHDSSCDKDIKTRLGKANSNFGRLHCIWRSKVLNIKIKVRLYESLILSTLLYAAETWPMTIGGGSYWAGRAMARPLLGSNGPVMMLARPLFGRSKYFFLRKRLKALTNYRSFKK